MTTSDKIIGAAIGIAGVAVIAWSAGWLPALGVFLMMWGDNIVRAKGE